MLADVGVIERDPFDARPRFDERALVHAPDERLFFDGNGRTACCPIMTITMRSTRASSPAWSAAPRHRQRWPQGICDSARRILARPGMDGARSPDLPAMAESRRLYRTDAALVRRLLLPRRLRRGGRCRVRLGGPALLRQPWRPCQQCRRWRRADMARRIARLVTRLTSKIDARMHAGQPWRAGMAVRIDETSEGVSVLCAHWPDGVTRPPRSFAFGRGA
jgi:hypothetical protein